MVVITKELSIFVDESGDFGDYAEHSSYYIVSMVFHDQSVNIMAEINELETKLASLGSLERRLGCELANTSLHQMLRQYVISCFSYFYLCY